jgi:hypothetical protein
MAGSSSAPAQLSPERNVNSAGYALMADGKRKEAIELFKINVAPARHMGTYRSGMSRCVQSRPGTASCIFREAGPRADVVEIDSRKVGGTRTCVACSNA